MIRGVVLLLELLAATPARANILTDADMAGFVNFDNEVPAILRDVQDAANSSPGSTAGQCLLMLADNLTLVRSEITIVEVVALLATQMDNSLDEAQVIEELRGQIRTFFVNLAIQRKDINGTIGLCAASGPVAVKSQDILHLYDEAASLVGAISTKIGPRAPR